MVLVAVPPEPGGHLDDRRRRPVADLDPQAQPVPREDAGMGKEARTALLLAASACLLAVMVEWIIGELNSDLSELGS